MNLEQQLKIKKVNLKLESYGEYIPIFSPCPYKHYYGKTTGDGDCTESSNRLFYAKYTPWLFFVPCQNHLEIALRSLTEVE
jgi:hypothetical protein